MTPILPWHYALARIEVGLHDCCEMGLAAVGEMEEPSDPTGTRDQPPGAARKGCLRIDCAIWKFVLSG